MAIKLYKVVLLVDWEESCYLDLRVAVAQLAATIKPGELPVVYAGIEEKERLGEDIVI